MAGMRELVKQTQEKGFCDERKILELSDLSYGGKSTQRVWLSFSKNTLYILDSPKLTEVGKVLLQMNLKEVRISSCCAFPLLTKMSLEFHGKFYDFKNFGSARKVIGAVQAFARV